MRQRDLVSGPGVGRHTATWRVPRTRWAPGSAVSHTDPPRTILMPLPELSAAGLRSISGFSLADCSGCLAFDFFSSLPLPFGCLAIAMGEGYPWPGGLSVVRK